MRVKFSDLVGFVRQVYSKVNGRLAAVFVLAAYLGMHGPECCGQVPSGGDYRPFKETLLVNTDRNVYLAGEPVYLSLFDRGEGATSTICYLDMINSVTAEVISSQKIEMAGEGGSGQVKLAKGLASGAYELHAYTRNIGLGNAAVKNFYVINTSMALPREFAPKVTGPALANDDVLSIGISEQTLSLRKPLTVTLSQQPSKESVERVSVSIYLEDSLELINGQTTGIFQHQLSSNTIENNQREIYAERNGQVITGRIVSKSTGAPLNTIVYLSIGGKKPKMLCKRSFEGKFLFELPQYRDSANLVLLSPGTDYQISIDPRSSQYNVDSIPGQNRSLNSAEITSQIQQRHVSSQVNRAFFIDSLLPADHLLGDTSVFFGKADEAVNLDDYTRFNTMDEVFRELIKTVMVRKVGDTLHLHCLDVFETNPKFMDQDPLVLLDGIPIFNNKMLFAIDPLRIKRISVLARKFYNGPILAEGVVSIQTYTGDFAGIKLDENALVAEWSGTQVPLAFYCPNYSQDLQWSMPDQRITLYWNPAISIRGSEQKISFYTGDIPGRYRVVACGMSKDGKVLFCTKTFNVSKP